MINNPAIQSYYTDNKKKATVMKITGAFSPSPFETFKCILVLERKMTHNKWEMVDLLIFNYQRNRYETILALYSYILLEQITSQVLDECRVEDIA